MDARLEFLASFAAAGVDPELIQHPDGGTASFVVDGEIRWAIAYWTRDARLAGFLVRDLESGIEITVRDLAGLRDEPLLQRFARNLIRDAGLVHEPSVA